MDEVDRIELTKEESRMLRSMPVTTPFPPKRARQSNMEFTEAVEEILVLEHCRTRDEAKEMVKRFPKVMVNAMMAGHGREYRASYRAAAIALEISESDAKPSEVERP